MRHLQQSLQCSVFVIVPLSGPCRARPASSAQLQHAQDLQRQAWGALPFSEGSMGDVSFSFFLSSGENAQDKEKKKKMSNGNFFQKNLRRDFIFEKILKKK